MISDRAKRYRAHSNPPPMSKHCHYCGQPGNHDLEHVDGDEGNNEQHNLAWACRSCNTMKGAHFAKLGRGVRTRQYNPSGEGARSLAQWVKAVMVTKGIGVEMTLRQAVDMIHNTSAAKRSEYARAIWSTRRARGTDRRQDYIPF
jgi:hypothetical protein